MRFQVPVLSGIIPVALGIIVFVFYRRIVPVYFISDDFMLLRIVGGGLLSTNIMDHVTSHWLLLQSYGMYRPVSSLLFSLAYRSFGSDPFWYHSVSVCVHSVNAMLVIFIANSLTRHKSAYIGYVAGLLFALHPLHPNAVAWVSAFPTVLSTFLVLLSLQGFLAFRETRLIRYYVFSLGTFLFALGTYEPTAVYPALLMVCDWMKNDGRVAPHTVRTLAVEYAPYVVLVVVYFAAKKVLFGSFFFDTVLVYHVARIVERVSVYPRVLAKLIYPLFSLDSMERALRLVFFASFGVCAVILFRRLTVRENVVMALFVVCWAFGATITTEPVLEPIYGRYGYLASIGTCIGLSFFIVRSLSFSGKGTSYLLPAMFVVLVVFSYVRLLNQSLGTYEKAGKVTRAAQQDLVMLDSSRKGNTTYFLGNMPRHFVSDGYNRTQLFIPGLSDSVRPPFTEKKILIYPFIDFSAPAEVASIISAREIVLLTWNGQLEQVQLAASPQRGAEDGPRLSHIEVVYPHDNARITGFGDNLGFVFAGGTYEKLRLTFLTPPWEPLVFDVPRGAAVQLKQLQGNPKDKGIPEDLHLMGTGDDFVVFTLPYFPRFFMDTERIYGDEVFWWIEALDMHNHVIARSAMRSFRIEQ